MLAAAFGFVLMTLIVLFIFVSLVLILIVLIQKGRGGGLASAFGGAGGHTAFGAKTGDVLTWATSIIFGVFLILSIALNLMANSASKPLTPAAPAAPAGGTPSSQSTEG